MNKPQLAARIHRFSFALVVLMLSNSCRVQVGDITTPEPGPVVSTQKQQRAATVEVHTSCGSGSGIAVSARVVLTAEHVIKCAGKTAGMIFIRNADDRMYIAEVVSRGAGDTAALKVAGALHAFVPFVVAKPAGIVCRSYAVPKRGMICGPVVRSYHGETSYATPGQSGNSGSGVFDFYGRIVGIHTQGLHCSGDPGSYRCRGSILDTRLPKF